jgi:hypothetical protein
MPILGGAHRRLKNSPPHFLGSALIKVLFVEQILNVIKRGLRDGYVFYVLEPILVG